MREVNRAWHDRRKFEGLPKELASSSLRQRHLAAVQLARAGKLQLDPLVLSLIVWPPETR